MTSLTRTRVGAEGRVGQQVAGFRTEKPPGNEIGLHVACVSLCDHGNKRNHTATGSQVLILGRRVRAN